MKKLFFAAVAVLGFTATQAQEGNSTGGFAKGDTFITGAFTISSDKTGDDKSSGFEIAPQVGYFVSDNIAIGAKIGYESSSAESSGVDTEDLAGFKVGAFGRYYFTPANQFSLFGQLGVDYASEEDKLANYKVNDFGVALGAGLNYFVSSNFSIEAGVGVLGYNSSKPDVSGADATNSFSFGGDWTSVTIGVNYKF